MAGISIRLEKLLNEKNYISNAWGYFITAFAVAGPWIVTIIVLTVFSSLYSQEIRVSFDYRLLNATIIYGFIGSQLITVPFQYFVTRYLADEIYLKRREFIRPTFIGLGKIVAVISLIVGTIIFIRGGLTFAYVAMSVYFFVMTALVWVSSFFLSAINEHFYLGKSFLFGGVAGFLVMTIFNQAVTVAEYPITISGLVLMLTSMTCIFMANAIKVFRNVTTSNGCEFDFLRGLSDYPSLFFIGVFYIFGLWIDKFIMWGSAYGINLNNFLYVNPPYDQSAFLSSLFIIPANVLFLTVVEVYFIRYYKLYYDKTREGVLEDIILAKKEMRMRLFSNLFKIILIQSAIIMFAFLFSDQIFNFLNYDVVSKQIFVNLLMGNLFFVMTIVFMTLLLYFEERMKALLVMVIAFTLNTGFTFVNRELSVDTFGVGFSLAMVIAYTFSLIFLVIGLNETDYKLFGVNSVIYKKKKGYFARLADNQRIRNGVDLDE